MSSPGICWHLLHIVHCATWAHFRLGFSPALLERRPMTSQACPVPSRPGFVASSYASVCQVACSDKSPFSVRLYVFVCVCFFGCCSGVLLFVQQSVPGRVMNGGTWPKILISWHGININHPKSNLPALLAVLTVYYFSLLLSRPIWDSKM